MAKVKLIHWKIEEVEDRESILGSAGYDVDSFLESGAQVFKSLAEDQPAAIIIDLSRFPSQGRDFAIQVRARKGTRYIPLIFVGGKKEQLEKIKALLPDAWYTTWDQIIKTVPDAIATPLVKPIFLDSAFAGYSGKALVEKLGIKHGMTVGILRKPDGFEKNLHPLPAGVKIMS